MTSGKTIICFASGWDYHPTSKHHVMRQLAMHNQVVWVNWHASRRPGVGWSDLSTMIAKLGEIRRGPRHVLDNLHVLTPCQVPLPASRLARRLNTRMVCGAIRRVIATLPAAPVQMWTFAPDVAEFAGRFDEELVLYYCVDAFGEFPGYDRALIEARERELLARCDVVLTTSAPLLEARRRLHRNVHLVAHGVDYGHLSKAVTEDLPVPPELRGLPRPVFGFVGVIGEWVDLDLVAGLARSWPRASTVMIGPEAKSRGPCAGLPNVHWLGPRQHATLPTYLRCLDVGLIPFRHLPLTYHANPVKLHEYLAAGVPVVSTSLPAVSEVLGSVWLADDVAGLREGCQRALEHNEPAHRRDRSRLMLTESWAARLEQIDGLVAAALEGRRAGRRGMRSS